MYMYYTCRLNLSKATWIFGININHSQFISLFKHFLIFNVHDDKIDVQTHPTSLEYIFYMYKLYSLDTYFIWWYFILIYGMYVVEVFMIYI